MNNKPQNLIKAVMVERMVSNKELSYLVCMDNSTILKKQD